MIDLLNTLFQWLNPMWVVEQSSDGDGLPFMLWTVIVATAGLGVGFFVNKKLAGFVPKSTIAKGFSPEIKQAALESLDSPGSVVIGDKFEALVSFARSRSGVFSFAYPIDEVGDADKYQLTDEWRAYLSKHRKYLD